MNTLLLLCLVSFADVKIVKLDSNGRYLGHINSDSVNLLEDGSILFTSRYKVLKFDSDGELQLEFGGRGDGPGEFVEASTTIVTDEFFIVLDTSRLMLNFFSKDGEYISRHTAPYRQILARNDKVFAVTLKEIMLGKTYPRAVVELQLNQKGEYIPVGEPFHPFSKECRDLLYNFKMLFMQYNQGGLYLIDQLLPQVFIYNADSLEQLSSIPLRLKGFERAPDQPPKAKNKLEYVSWVNSWSRITFLDYQDGIFFVSYTLPMKSDREPMSKPDSMLSFFDHSGTDVREPMRFSQDFIGVLGNQLYFIEEITPDEGPIKYILRKVELD